MREWRLHCCKARFVFSLLGVSLLIGCNKEPTPQLAATIRVIPRTASRKSPRPQPTANTRSAERRPQSPDAAVPSPAVASTAKPTKPAKPAKPAEPAKLAAQPAVPTPAKSSARANVPAPSKPIAAAVTETTAPWPPTPMAVVAAGSYRPFFPGKDEPDQRKVAAFRLDVTPVTIGAFRDFVRAHPTWRRSAIPRIFADTDYLRLWRADIAPGIALNTVVTHVSWFAARAYCRSLGKRLPAMKEWERAALASNVAADGRKDPTFNARILRWYGHPARGRPGPVGQKPPNFFGLRDLHGLVWEWVEDFNTALVTGESRADSALERGLYCGAGSIGAADPSDYAAFMRFALRSSLKAAYTTGSLGFRCAADIPSGGKK